MISNYLLTGWRHARKNSLYISINVLGLALGVACCIVAFFNWQFHDDFDSGHTHEQAIYKVNTVKKNGGELQKYGTSPAPLSSALSEGFSDIDATTRYWAEELVFRLGETVLRQKSGFVDASFIEIFSFPLKAGSFDLDNNGIVLTEKAAQGLFGTGSPLGRSVELLVDDKTIELQVNGVMRDHPLNSSFQFQVLLPYQLCKSIHKDLDNDWSAEAHATFIFARNIDPVHVEKRLNKFVENVNSADLEAQVQHFCLVPLNDMAEEAKSVWYNYLGQNNPTGSVMIPTIMAIMILLVACFNFTNTSIALAGKRVKEIGVRKALGGERNGIAAQLFFESLIVVAVSLGLGVLLAEIFVPLYNELGPWIELKITYGDNLILWLFLLTLLVISAVLGGLYPALYVSRFTAQQVFKQRIKLRGSNWFTKSLLVLQLVFSTIALVQGVLYVQNSKLQQVYPLGFNKGEIITVPVPSSDGLEGFTNELKQKAGIHAVAMAKHHIGYGMQSAVVYQSGEEIPVRWLEVGPQYIDIMDVRLIDGRPFNLENAADFHTSVLVNEDLMKTLEIDIQQELRIDDQEYTVVGVVNNFYPFGLWRGEQNRPAVFKLVDSGYRYVVVNAGNQKTEADDKLRNLWPRYFPDAPYESDLDNKQVYLSELLSNNMSNLSFFQAIVAIFLAVNALFTMVSISIMNRTKEIGVRKVMGASVFQVFTLFNKGVLIVLGISVVFGLILGSYMSELFLDLMFSVHAHLDMTTIVVTCLVLFTATYATIGYRLVEASKSDPVDSLRYE